MVDKVEIAALQVEDFDFSVQEPSGEDKPVATVAERDESDREQDWFVLHVILALSRVTWKVEDMQMTNHIFAN